MTRRNLVRLVAALALVLVGEAFYYGSPYWTVWRMQTAARAGEGDRLASYVDFPAVRESVRSQMQQKMLKLVQDETLKDNPFAAFGMALAGVMVNTMVDNMVTRESLVEMIRRGRAKVPSETTPASTPTSSVGNSEAATPPRIDRHYEGADTFHVEMHDPATDKAMLLLVLNREGWFGWKLTAIRMPVLLER